MAITAAVAVAFAARDWLESVGWAPHFGFIVMADIVPDTDERCSRMSPAHRPMTPVVYGGIHAGIWLSIFLYSPRRLDWVLLAVLAVVVLG